jgi:hypothetical protein
MFFKTKMQGGIIMIMTKNRSKVYQGEHLSSKTIIAFWQGEVTCEEYGDILLHCETCEVCWNFLAETEENIMLFRPVCLPSMALNGPSKPGCPTKDEIKSLVAGDESLPDYLQMFAALHFCVCPRCYSFFCQSQNIILNELPEDVLIATIPLNTLSEESLIKLIGKRRYQSFRSIFHLTGNGSIVGHLLNGEEDYGDNIVDINRVALQIEYHKNGQGEYEINKMTMEDFEYYLDGIAFL